MSYLTKEKYKQKFDQVFSRLRPDQRDDYVTAFIEVLLKYGYDDFNFSCNECGVFINPFEHFIYCYDCYDCCNK